MRTAGPFRAPPFLFVRPRGWIFVHRTKAKSADSAAVFAYSPNMPFEGAIAAGGVVPFSCVPGGAAGSLAAPPTKGEHDEEFRIRPLGRRRRLCRCGCF